MDAGSHSGFDRSQRLRQPIGNLGLGQTIKVGQLQNLALGLRKICQRAVHRHSSFRPGGGRLDVFAGLRPSRVISQDEAFFHSTDGAYLVDRPAARNINDPCLRAAPLHAIALRLTPDLDKNLLKQILGVGTNPQHSHREGKNEVREAIVKLAEGIAILPRDFLDEVNGDCLVGRHRYSLESQTVPRRCIGPVGLGTPPAGSRVTANLSNDFPWGSEGIFSRVWGLSSTEKVPTGTGSSPAIAQSS